MRFEFATAQRIVFGAGVVSELAAAVSAMGRRPLVVTGRSRERAARHVGALDAVWLAIDGEPTLEVIRQGTGLGRAEGCDVVAGFGGGSAIDAAKAIASMMNNSGEPLDYLEVIGKGQPIAHASVPFIAVPTTAGTGTEVTRNAVLASPEHGVKASLRSPFLLPRLALVDPELALDLPRDITAATGMDALTQLIEPYVCTRANAFTDALCVDGMTSVAAGLREAFHAPTIEARTRMSYAALLSGMCLANAGLGAVHGFAAAIGGMFSAPHGAVCAALLPAVTRANLAAGAARERYERVSQLVAGGGGLVPFLLELQQELEIPGLRRYGISRDDFGAIAEKAAEASSMKPNPAKLSREALFAILEEAL